ncbi:hypothetical protein IT413_01290 [Candidatus Peregrinibacteria bacterium]|nr:hypothetical protein [Candidatus Peregrinibacteria bacterium]
MATDRKKTTGLGAVGKKDLPDGRPEGVSISVPSSPHDNSMWFQIINTHLSGLEARLAPLKRNVPNAIINTNPIDTIDRLMESFFGDAETIEHKCSNDGGKTLDPAKFFEYLTKAFSKIVTIIDSKEAQQFYSIEDRAVILENCQRNLSFMAAIVPGVSAEFEKYVSDPDNGGVVPGAFRPLGSTSGVRRSNTQPYLGVATVPGEATQAETAPASEAVPSSTNRRSSIPISSEQLYPARARRKTLRPIAAPREKQSTLVGLDDMARKFSEDRDNGVLEIDDVVAEPVPTAVTSFENVQADPVGHITSMLPPPMVEAIAEQEAQHKLEAVQRAALKEFEKLFVEAYEDYFREYAKIYHQAIALINSEEAEPVKKAAHVLEGEKLIEDLEVDLMKDPEEIAEIAYGLALEKMNATPESYPGFLEFYLERGKLDYDVQFKHHAKAVFAENSRKFVDNYLPIFLAKMVTPQGVKRTLNIHYNAITDAQKNGNPVPKDLEALEEIIGQIILKDAVILYEDWAPRLASALASQTFLSLGENLYRSKKPELAWGLYFYQESKREITDQVYQPIFDAYLPLCEEYQDVLRPDVQANVDKITAEYAATVAGVATDTVDLSTDIQTGETELSDEDLLALDEALDQGVVVETGEAAVSREELAEINRYENEDSFGEMDFSDDGFSGADLTAQGDRVSTLELQLRKMMDSMSGVHIHELPQEITLDSVIIGDDMPYEVSDNKLPPLPDVIDPATFMGDDKSFKNFVMSILQSPDKVVEFRGYAFGITDIGGFIMAKDGWIILQDKVTEQIEYYDELGQFHEKNSEVVLGTWYFRPPNMLFPARRPAAGEKEQSRPLSMTIEDVRAFYNKMPKDYIRALYMKSFEDSAGIADPFPNFVTEDPFKYDGSAEALLSSLGEDPNLTVGPTAIGAPDVVSEVLTHLPSTTELYGAMDENDRPTMPPAADITQDEITRPKIPALKKKSSGWKYALAAAAMTAMGAMGYSGYKATQQNSLDSAVSSSSASNANSAKPVDSAKVAEVLNTQPQPVMTVTPKPVVQPPVVDIDKLPTRTYVSQTVLDQIPSKYTRAVVETGKLTVEGNGLGWAAQIATPFTRIATPQQQAKINELMHELNVGLYASSVKKYENAANVNAILMDPSHAEYNRVKFLIKPNVMGNPYNWDWKIFSRKTGKSWDVQAAYEYYQTFENEAMARNMDRHSPGVLHMGAWGGDVVEVYKDAKFMTFMVDVADVIGIDLKPPTTGSVDPSLLRKKAPEAPSFVPGLDNAPGNIQPVENKTGFLSPNAPDLNFGFGTMYGNGTQIEQPKYTFNFKPAAVDVEPASFDVDLSDLEPSVLALGGIDDISVDVDLSEFNGSTLADTVLDDSIDVDLSDLNALAEADAFDAEWDNIAAQHEAQKVVSPFAERVAQVKSNRREALMKRGEVWVPSLSDDMSGSAMLAFENGFLKECTSASQQQKVRVILSKVRLSSLEEYEALEDGSTYAKLSEKDVDALRNALHEPSIEDELAAIDAGWDLDEPVAPAVKLEDELAAIDAGWDLEEQTPESAMIVDVTRKINQRVGTVRLSA